MGQLPESYAALGQQILDSIQDNASVTQAGCGSGRLADGERS
jgi:hypothetical protein